LGGEWPGRLEGRLLRLDLLFLGEGWLGGWGGSACDEIEGLLDLPRHWAAILACGPEFPFFKSFASGLG